MQLSMQFLEETAKRGAGTCFLAASTDNLTIFGNDAFREHTLPGVRALREKARGLGMRPSSIPTASSTPWMPFRWSRRASLAAWRY